MTEIIELTIELQATLVGGYLAYKIASMGRSVADRTEDLILKVLTFGLLGKGSVAALVWLTQTTVYQQNIYLPPLTSSTVLEVAATVIAGVLWRTKGSEYTSSIMQKIGTYRDDHETSVLMSMANAKAVWNHIQIHLSDGRILESRFDRVNGKIPTGSLIINNDGLLIYVTKLHRNDGTKVEYSDAVDGEFSSPTYIPREKISQIDLCWKPAK